MHRLLSLALVLIPAAATAAPPAVTAVAFDPHNQLVAAATHSEIRVISVEKGDPRGVGKTRGRVTALTFGQHGKWLAAASGQPGKEGVVQLFFVSERLNGFASLSSEPPVEFNAHKDLIYTLAFSPDGKRLATAGYDRVIHLWDVAETGKVAKTPRLTLKDHSDTIYAVAFNHDGTLLASGSADRSVKVWDAATGKRLYTLNDPTDWVYCLAWSPDKAHLAAGAVDKSIRVWEANKDGGKLVRSAFAHEKPVWRLAYGPAGTTLYTAGEDRVIKAWDAAKLTEKTVFEAQTDTILDFAVRPDGKELAVARFDGALVLLDPATGKVTAQPLPAKAPPPAPPEPPKSFPPKPVKLTPNGGTRGTTTKITVTGTDLDRLKAVNTSVPDVTVKFDPSSRKPGSIELEVTLDAKAAIGAVQLTFEGDGGKSAPVPFAVDRFPAIAEAGITDSARAAQRVKLPVSVAGAIDRAGDADFYRFDAKAGDEIGVQVVASALGSKLEPVLVLTDAGGAVVAEGDAVLGYVVPRAGTYSVGLRDKEFRGGADFIYRLHLGPIPVVTGVFPLAVQRGRTADVHVEGVNLGAPGGLQAKVTIPANAAPGSRVPLMLPDRGEKPLGSASVLAAEFPSAVADPIEGGDIRVPGSCDGILTKPNEAQLLRFHAKKGQRLIVEALARRAGSPVDPVIEILDASGKPLPRAVLRATAKTYSVFRDHDSKSPGIRIEAWNDLAIDDYLYVDSDLLRIVALPKNPDDDCQFYQDAGQRVGYLGTTPSHHALGSVMYKVEQHPPGTTFPPNGLPVFPISYRNDDGGADYGKDSMLVFDPPAEGDYQVRVTDARGASGPTHAYRITVRPPKPDFSVSFNPTAPSVWKGGGVSVGVTITRTDGFDGAVKLKLEGLPPGFSAPETFVEAGHDTTAFTLFAEENATVPADAKLKLVARATIGGKDVVREAAGGVPKVVPPGDIVTHTRVSEVVIRPGQETRFVVDIERQGTFKGRVPLEVRGLPHGVRVLNIGLNGILITEREASREVVLYAEPWVKPMNHPIVVLARREGKNTEHAAKSVLLKVQR